MLNLEQLGMFADLLQVLNYIENTSQSSNDRIMAELEHQNQDYFKEIFERFDRLEEKLEVINENYKRNSDGNS